MLSVDTLPAYLVDRRLVSTGDLVDGHGSFEIQDRSRRNRNFLVRSSTASLLVKQAGNPHEHSSSVTVTAEAELLRAVAVDDYFKPLRWFSPRFVYYDPDAIVLVTELVEPATSLTKFHLNAGSISFAEEAGVTCGRVLAAFHTRLGAGARADYVGVREREPFVFGLPTSLREAGASNPVAAELGALVVGSGVYDDVERARQLWNAHRDAVHCDVRWDNVLLTAGAAPGDNMNLRLIDWELATVGDGIWDVACYLAEYLRLWSLSGEVVTSDPGDPRFSFDLGDLHLSASAFLDAYRRRRGYGDGGWRAARDRLLVYLPFALMIAAYESIQRAPALPLNARLGVRLATEALADPAARATEWFGGTW